MSDSSRSPSPPCAKKPDERNVPSFHSKFQNSRKYRRSSDMYEMSYHSQPRSHSHNKQRRHDWTDSSSPYPSSKKKQGACNAATASLDSYGSASSSDSSHLDIEEILKTQASKSVFGFLFIIHRSRIYQINLF